MPLAVLWAVLVGLLGWLLYTRATWNEESDRADVREWLDNTRVFRKTLTELLREYVELLGTENRGPDYHDRVQNKRAEIEEHMRAMVEPTRMYAGQLPLFPNVYSLEVEFDGVPDLDAHAAEVIEWVSPKPRPGGSPARRTRHPRIRTGGFTASPARGSTVRCVYQLHSFNRMQKQQDEFRSPGKRSPPRCWCPPPCSRCSCVARFLRARARANWRSGARRRGSRVPASANCSPQPKWSAN